MHEYTGKCHCGNIHYSYITTHTKDTLPVRYCGCEFCRKHGVAYTSDPTGKLEIVINAPEAVQRYRFSTRVVDFLLCTQCGVMTAALTRIDDNQYAVLNANTLNGEVTLSSVKMDVSAETPEEGQVRRKRNWIGQVTLFGDDEKNGSD